MCLDLSPHHNLSSHHPHKFLSPHLASLPWGFLLLLLWESPLPQGYHLKGYQMLLQSCFLVGHPWVLLHFHQDSNLLSHHKHLPLVLPLQLAQVVPHNQVQVQLRMPAKHRCQVLGCLHHLCFLLPL